MRRPGTVGAGHRAEQLRTVMTYRTARALCAILVVCSLAGCGERSHVSAPTAAQQVPSPPTAGAASAALPPREEPFPIPVIELSGRGADIGREHAAALGDGIRALHGRYITAYYKNAAAKIVALSAAGLFEPKLAPEHLSEVKALAAGTSIDPRQMMLAQCFLDLSPMVACSTVTLPAAASPDGVARFGRNLDFPSFGVADKASVVLIYRPEGRYQFASIAWPGMTGVLTGMNEHGLTLANMEVRRGPRVPTAMPYILLYRSVLERCQTVGEAVEFLRDTPRQSANNLMLMDASGTRAVVELTPDGVEVREGRDDSALISTNHQRGQDADASGRCKRYDYLRDTSAEQFGEIDVPAVESMLAGVAQGKLTMQSMVFEPANRVVYLSTGKNAASGQFHRLDLKQHFRPQPPAAVAPVNQMQPRRREDAKESREGEAVVAYLPFAASLRAFAVKFFRILQC
jgi:predicted choloylglycine hydrolase